MSVNSSIPFGEISESCKGLLQSLCQRWLPHGHRSGNWWVCSCPWRDDKTASLGVSLSSGLWQDFGGAVIGKERGDMIKLFLLLYPQSCKDMVDAADSVAQIVGHPFRKTRR